MHRKLTRILAATALLLAGGLLTATPAEAGTTDPAEPSRVVIADRDRTAAATVRSTNDQFVWMQPLTGDLDQIWQLRDVPEGGTQIISEATGNCLKVAPVSDPDGSFVVQQPCGGLGADTWRIVPPEEPELVRIINVSTELCLTQPPPVTFDARLRVFGCEPDDVVRDQIFRLLPIT